jgi:serine/threonine protein kinase
VDKRRVGLAVLKFVLGKVPFAGDAGVEFIRSLEMDERIGERVERALEARFSSAVLPMLEELLRAGTAARSGAGATVASLGLELLPESLELLADEALQLSADPGNAAAADFAASLVGRVLDRPDVRNALTMPLLTGPGAVRVEEGTLLADRFRVLGALGLGAFSTVYRARDERSGCDVAVKIGADHRPGWQRQLLREGLRLGRLDHPAIVRVIETISVSVGPDSKTHAAIVMDFIDGSSLRAHVAERGGRLPWSKAKRVIECLLGALEHAHGQGVLHLDVKPENVMVVERDGTAKVLDFGLARAAGEENFTRVLGGTPGYMAPELTEAGEPTKAADIYSAGVVAYELLAGSLPDRHQLRLLRDLGIDIEPSVDAAIRKALEPVAAHRHSSAGAFWEALSGAPRKASPTSAIPDVPVPAAFSELRPVVKGRLLRLSAAFDTGIKASSLDTLHVAVSADGSIIAVSSPEKIVFMRPDGSGAGPPIEATRTEHLVLSADGRLCASAGTESSKLEDFTKAPAVVRVCSVVTGEMLLERRMKGHSRVALSPDGRVVVSGGFHADEITAWDVETGTPRWTQPLGDVLDLNVSPDGAHVLVSTGKEQALFESRDGKEVWRRAPVDRSDPGAIARGVFLPGARALAWEANRMRREPRGKKDELVLLGGRLLVTDAKGATVRRHELGGHSASDGKNIGVAGDVVYWLESRPSMTLKALDLRSGLEVESLDIGAGKLTLPSTLGASLAVSARRVILLGSKPTGVKVVLVYEVS